MIALLNRGNLLPVAGLVSLLALSAFFLRKRILQQESTTLKVQDEREDCNLPMENLITPQQVSCLKTLLAQEWHVAIKKWQRLDRVVLYDELYGIFGRGVCAWAGIPLRREEAPRYIDDLKTLFGSCKKQDDIAAKERLHGWLQEIIGQVRTGKLKLPESNAVCIIAHYRNGADEMFSQADAAAELLRVLELLLGGCDLIERAVQALQHYPGSKHELLKNTAFLETVLKQAAAGRNDGTSKQGDNRSVSFVKMELLRQALHFLIEDVLYDSPAQAFEAERNSADCITATGFAARNVRIIDRTLLPEAI